MPSNEVHGPTPTLARSAVCVGGVLAIVIVGVMLSEVEVHILLLGGLLWVGLNTTLLGYSFADVKTRMSEGLSHGLTAFYIFILIGIVIAGLIESGALATLVYHALNFVSPGWFLPGTLLICSFMSVATGTSWGTVGTVGVILVGVGGVIGVPLPIVGGAIVSGALFGDKMSPLSDTTILASSTAGTGSLRPHPLDGADHRAPRTSSRSSSMGSSAFDIPGWRCREKRSRSFKTPSRTSFPSA